MQTIRKVQRRGPKDRQLPAITVPATFCKELGVTFDSYVSLVLQDDAIVIRAVKVEEVATCMMKMKRGEGGLPQCQKVVDQGPQEVQGVDHDY